MTDHVTMCYLCPFTMCTCRVLIPAVNKKDSNLELHFFNNCFDDAFSKGTGVYEALCNAGVTLLI